MNRARLMVAVGAAGAALAIPTVAGAAPERFVNKEAAAAAGDPAGTGESRSAPTSGVFQGETLSFADIKERAGGLHCMTRAPESGGKTECFTSTSELLAATERAAPASTAAKAASADKQRGKVIARAASCPSYNVQVHFSWGSYNGDNYAINGRTYWQNLPSYMNNNTSSYAIGVTGGHMAENYDGGGYWYPGATGPCDQGSITYGSYPHWDNRISSGWRSL